MPLPTIEQLRAAAHWQAFKQGQQLASQVSRAETTENGWSGVLAGGPRPLRTTAILHGPNHIEVRCSCPDNRRDGSLCAHAVAIALALHAKQSTPAQFSIDPLDQLQATKPRATRSTQHERSQGAKHEPGQACAPKITTGHKSFGGSTDVMPLVMPYALMLSPRWREELVRQRLSLRLKPVPQEPASVQATPQDAASAADEALCQWLAAHQLVLGRSHQLALDASGIASLLPLLAGHPRVLCPDGRPIAVRVCTLLALADVTPISDDAVSFVAPSLPRTFLPSGHFVTLKESAVELVDTAAHVKEVGYFQSELKSLCEALAVQDCIKLPLDTFVAELEHLTQVFDFSLSPWYANLHYVVAEPRYHLAVSGNLQAITAKLTLRYESHEEKSLPRFEKPATIITKNHLALHKATEHLREVGFSATDNPHTFTCRKEADIRSLLGLHLPRLEAPWQLELSPELAALSLGYEALEPIVALESSEPDGAAKLRLRYENSRRTLSLSHAELKRLLRDPQQAARYVVPPLVAEVIDPLLAELDDLKQTPQGHYVCTSKQTADIAHELALRFSRGSNASPPELSQPPVPTTVRATLRSYQVQGFRWIIERFERHGAALLADDMGLGKTLQTLCVIEHLIARAGSELPPPCLLVAPATLLGNWQAEIERFLAHRTPILLHGEGRDARRAEIGPGRIVLTSFATLARDFAWHLAQEYHLVAVDEASLMRNPATDHAKALRRLRAQYRLALTGTPVENSAMDVWSIFEFLKPGWLGPHRQFESHYALPLASNSPPPGLATRLRLKTSPFTLRRTKAQVAPELPAKIELCHWVEMSRDQAAIYEQLRAQANTSVAASTTGKQARAQQMQAFTALLRLRQAGNDLALLGIEELASLPLARRSPKLAYLLELAAQTIAAGSRMLIFSQFARQLELARHSFSEAGIESLLLDGTTPHRQELVARFQKPDGPPVFFISLKAGGYGLNLTAADCVVLFDPWWNPAAEAQATDRAHRIGQRRPVTVHRLLTKHSVEERVASLQRHKQTLADALDESVSPAALPSGIDMAMIRELLS